MGNKPDHKIHRCVKLDLSHQQIPYHHSFSLSFFFSVSHVFLPAFYLVKTFLSCYDNFSNSRRAYIFFFLNALVLCFTNDQHLLRTRFSSDRSCAGKKTATILNKSKIDAESKVRDFHSPKKMHNYIACEFWLTLFSRITIMSRIVFNIWRL